MVILAIAGCSGRPYPEFLRRQAFRIHRRELERLVEMADSDYVRARVIRVAPEFTRLESDWSWPRAEAKWGVSRARWDEYRQLFRVADLPVGFERDSLAVFFPTYCEGFVVHGSEDGVVWSPFMPKSARSESHVLEVKHLEVGLARSRRRLSYAA
jgi:hypothetical protein